MLYDDSLLDDIRSRNDIVDVIGERMQLTKRGANYMGLCPFHGEKTPSFSVNRSKQIFKCFGCGLGGNVFKFIQEYENCSWRDAVRMMADRAGVELPAGADDPERSRKDRLKEKLYEINAEAAKFYYARLWSDTGKLGVRYFRDRALSDQTMKHFGLGYSDANGNTLYQYLKSKDYPDDLLEKSGLFTFDEKRGVHDKFWNRVMFPITDQNKRVLGFGGRVMGQGEPKYLNSPETAVFSKSNTLYGYRDAKQAKEKYILICEGYMDVISLWSAGFTSVVAALGTAFTPQHARKIRDLNRSIILTFDSDGAGKKAAMRAIPILRGVGATCRVLDMKPHKDPDEFIKALGPDEYRKRIENAVPSFEFEVSYIESGYDMADPEARTNFAKAIAEHIVSISRKDEMGDIERQNYIAYVDSQYHFGTESLRRLVNNIGDKSEQRAVAEAAREEVLADSKKVRNAESADIRSQKELINLACTDPGILTALKRYVDESYFTGICRKMIEIMFEKADSGGIAPAALINRFEDDEQNEVAEIFASESPAEQNEAGREKAFSEFVRNLLAKNLEARTAEALRQNDLTAYAQLIKEKQELSKKKITIKA